MLLKGDLGAGKTTLVKGIALGLGIKNEITSPTFALMNVYEVKSLRHRRIRLGRKKSIKSKVSHLVHIDTFRLIEEKELIEIGVEDYLGDENCICIIEWPEKLVELLRGKKTISVEIEDVGEDKRKIIIL